MWICIPISKYVRKPINLTADLPYMVDENDNLCSSLLIDSSMHNGVVHIHEYPADDPAWIQASAKIPHIQDIPYIFIYIYVYIYIYI